MPRPVAPRAPIGRGCRERCPSYSPFFAALAACAGASSPPATRRRPTRTRDGRGRPGACAPRRPRRSPRRGARHHRRSANVPWASDRVTADERGLADKSPFRHRRPMIEVTGRRRRDAQREAVAGGGSRRRAARGQRERRLQVKTEARDSNTQKLAISFAPACPTARPSRGSQRTPQSTCGPPAAGGPSDVLGLAGPDITLGTDAMRAQWGVPGAGDRDRRRRHDELGARLRPRNVGPPGSRVANEQRSSPVDPARRAAR